jgi:hypothetical protein
VVCVGLTYPSVACLLGAMVRGREERAEKEEKEEKEEQRTRTRGDVLVRRGGAVAEMEPKEACGAIVVKAVKRIRLLQMSLLCLVAVVIVAVVFVVAKVKVERIALGASCTKCREATIALELGAGNWGPSVRRKGDEHRRPLNMQRRRSALVVVCGFNSRQTCEKRRFVLRRQKEARKLKRGTRFFVRKRGSSLPQIASCPFNRLR